MSKNIFRKLKQDARGVTLVEIACVVGILALLGVTISGILLFVSNSYRRGNTETELQQEAQFTANRINGLIMDATDDVEYGFYESGEMRVAGNETEALAAGAGANTDRYLKIHNADTIVVIHYSASGKKLFYREMGKSTSVDTGEQLLAEYIVDFEADTTTFAENRSVALSLCLEKDEKGISSNYIMWARNGVPVNFVEEEETKSASIRVTGELVLEPNNDYFLPVNVSGIGIQNSGFRMRPVSEEELDEETAFEATSEGIWIKPGKNESGGSDGQIYLTIDTVEKDGEGNPLDTAVVSVKIRRVIDTTVEYRAVSGTPAALAETAFKASARYMVKGVTSGQNLTQKSGYAYDMDYKNPYYIKWSYFYEQDGSRYDETTSVFKNRFRIVRAVENYGEPYAEIELLQDMPEGSRLIVKGSSKHALGTVDGISYNKSGEAYGEISNYVALDSTLSTEDVIYIVSGDARGEDIFFDTTLNLTELRDRYAPGDGNAQFYWLYRIREKTDDGTLGAWTEYRNMLQGGSEKKLNATESQRFMPGSDYQFEIIGTVINKDTNTLYWPCDESLLASDTGLSMLSKGFGDSEPVTAKSEYSSTFEMPKVTVSFQGNAAYGIADNSPSYGTEDNPVRVTVGEILEVAFYETNGIKLDAFKAHFKSVVQKKNGEDWDDVSIQFQQGGTYYLDNLQNYEKGLYRIGVVLENASFLGDSSGLWDSNYSTISNVTCDLYDFDKDTGTIYFEIY